MVKWKMVSKSDDVDITPIDLRIIIQALEEYKDESLITYSLLIKLKEHLKTYKYDGESEGEK